MRPIFCAALALAASSPAFSQAPPPAAPAAPAAPGALNIQQETEALVNAAGALFAEAKYQEALAKLAIAKKNLNNKPFESILFTEGACYYNLNDYPKAIEALEAYVKEFPTGGAIIDVRMALGRSYIASKQEDKGIEVLTDVVRNSPEKKAEAGLIIADTLNKQGKQDEALKILTNVIEGGIRSAESIQAAMLAANIYVATGKLDEATALMDKVRNFASGGDSIAQMNNIYLKLGDEMMEKKAYKEALGAYQLVRKKAEISRIQADQIAKLEGQLKTAKGVRKDEIETKLKANREIMAEIEKRTDYDASLYYRLGRCYYEMGAPREDGAGDPSRLWQAILAFEVIVNEYKQFPQRDKCLYGLITVNAALKRIEQVGKECTEFVDLFPDSEMVGEVGMMKGMILYQNKKSKEAIIALKDAMRAPKADKERLSFVIGSILFELQSFDECRQNYEALLQNYPQTIYKDDVQYRIALTYFYQNDYKSVTKALKTYIKDNPKGQYVVDARYRLAFIDFQGGDKKNAEAELLSIIKDAPNDQNIGQVHALLGDIYNQRADYENAMVHFAAAVDKAKTDDVLTYALDQLTDLYVGANKWKELAEVWQRYYNTHKDNEDLSLKAILWISRALIKDGKVEDAKKLLAEHIKTRIPNVANQQVEGLIQQLVTISAPKRRRATAAAAPAPAPTDGAKPADGTKPAEGAAAPPPAPEQTFEEVEKQLEELLSPPQAAMNGTAQMRILFAKTWLAKTMKLPDKAEKYFNIIIEVAKPDDLSPMLLATVGDSARKKGDLTKAEACYTRLNELFKDSEYADGAAVGKGEIAFEKGEYDKALELFRAALSDYPGSSRVLDATQGEAKTLFKLKKYDEAKKIFEQIANTKEWRGHATANALRMLGEIEAAQGKHEASIAYFQRVFIAHQKWKDEMAKAYLLCSKSFIALSKKEEAKKTLEEMLARKDLEGQPEMKEAEKLLGTL
ncbi:tetratricopeptide repeat protein [Prosthecobacter sp.]|uniref:tetratricopeptide repeat protein n=1 Tax=Prosthecobacter sp. TaxID=1965333 RepID=UPI003784098C